MGVFEDFRRAWREAVSNFWRELEGDEGAGGAVGSAGAYREVARVRNQLSELDSAIAHARQRVGAEREQVEACVRRERMARDIGDAETARIAAEYAARHRERAEVLGRKLEALESERRLWFRDLKEIEAALRDGRAAAGGAWPERELEDLNRHPREDEFRGLEDADRGRAAEQRLEELKRRMGGQAGGG